MNISILSLSVQLLGGVILAATVLIAFHKIATDIKIRLLSISIIILPLIYVGFVLIGLANHTATTEWLYYEFAGLIVFSGFALLSLRISPYFIAAGWGLHIIWDALFHFDAAFVPYFYPAFCIGFDAVIALYAIYLLRGQK